MINNNKIDRNQSMIISLDEMVPENSIVRVIDAYFTVTNTQNTMLFDLLSVILTFFAT